MFSERTVRKVFLVLDARWEVRWKDLNDYARETDTLDVLEDHVVRENAVIARFRIE